MPYHKLLQEENNKITKIQNIQISNLVLCTLQDGTVKLINNPFELKLVREADNLIIDYLTNIITVSRTGWLICSSPQYKG